MAAVALLAGGVGVAGWWLLRPGPSADDEVLPADAELTLIVRPAELWAVPAVKKQFPSDIPPPRHDPDVGEVLVARLRNAIGLSPEQIERFTLVAYRPADRHVWAVVRALDPLDEQAVLAGLGGPRPMVVAGQRFHVSTDGRKRAVAFLGPTTLLFGDEASVKTALALRAARPARGPLAGLPAAAKGHHVALGVAPGEAWREKARLRLPPFLTALANLKAATVLVDAGEPLSLQASAALPDAAEERAALVAAVPRAQAVLPNLGLVPLPAEAAPLAALLARAKVEVDGDVLRLHAEGEAGPLLKALAEWLDRAEW